MEEMGVGWEEDVIMSSGHGVYDDPSVVVIEDNLDIASGNS